MPIQWVDTRDNSIMTLPRLIKSYIDKEDPSCAIHHMLYLAERLLLSNHLTEGHLIASAVFRLIEDFETTAKGERLDHHIYVPNTFETFWYLHKSTFPRPQRVPPWCPIPSEGWLAKEQWEKYRECTRTGWMLEHLGLAEPKNPLSIWRETDDPAMLAMCARLLAKTTTPGTYPPENLAREALGAAQKLYSIPEVLNGESGKKPDDKRKHSLLVYPRLAIELAIRVGELQTAADILGQELRRDESKAGNSVTGFLMVPGIYDVLPLLARGGKENNPFFIPKEDAVVMTREITAVLELRAEHGRQWELDPSKVGWRELLDRLSEGAWKAHNKECRAMGWKGPKDLLFEPATEKEIAETEERFGELPADLKEMVRLSNGFKGGWHFFEGGMTGIRGMTTDGPGYTDIAYDHYDDVLGDYTTLGKLIEIPTATTNDGFDHFIILPGAWKKAMELSGQDVKEGEYQYWQWTGWWACDICPWDSVRDYVADCVERVEERIEKGQEEYWKPGPNAHYPGEVETTEKENLSQD
ncbi:hypothetical protein N7457_001622 [Penicillium paradoxum]|uniref:uncharacterized protein n=1 Tax=Penicillium paradoxum TaxID=176176 RepID=UPI002548B587|nr:uncharacterized protein N7457_001622 [Penicillium paradoxum]KAJ5795023.1 hypothetical protein N7457_001622 [Penicillium paradoxum]